MTNRQKRAIGYAIRARAQKRREAFIIEREGGLDSFKKSRYKSLFWYILAKYGKRIY
jgi:hypothetical protein